ncbi:hypothetical protein F901_02907 [Acinetobacter dispersus]|uniref:hypothetical protein n=1 Tax=Acinetobacter dispersus TaxID=70348 RepID=UPI0002D0B56A|nr:hypothetical protein [Acinetobacter dispersus]ENX51719.1 hypothetical protein F901_02907 [Acinetobacter dispersus]MCU4336395.1 hypothetical protein [Acinetobacter dispersus]QHH97007.1 hypothetical protein FPL17_05365 [Acinetobacter dispersus]
MLKDITIIDFQGKERRAQASYTEVKTTNTIQSTRVQSPKVEYILIKGEIIYPTLNLVFNSSDGNSYYIE